MVGGAALFDMDRDGDLDAYLVQSGSLLDPPENRPGNRLYRNSGKGFFEDVTTGSGAGDRGYGMGVSCGDYNNDSHTDLYITNVGPNVLLAGDGAGRFVDVTDAAGVGDAGWGAGSAFFDYDRDGDLDLFVCNYLIWSVETKVDCHSRLGGLDYCSPQTINAPAVDVLYRNNGDGTFTNVTQTAGLGDTLGTGLGVVCGDFNGDGWPDIFVANDGMEDRLWINRQDGSFENQALLAGCAVDVDGTPKAGMGVAALDIDNDSDLDLLVCNLNGQSDSIFINDMHNGGYFSDGSARTAIAGVSRAFTRFGVGWLDFDNDGQADLFQANGRVVRHDKLYSSDVYAEPNLLFRGLANGRFEEVNPRGGTIEQLVATSRAAAFGDVDGDGGVDILVANKDAPAHLLINAVPHRGHWLMLRTLDEHGRHAIGATIAFQVGGQTITRVTCSAYSYLAANDPRVHVGMGHSPLANDITVHWPDGTTESFGDQRANQVVTLRKGSGQRNARSSHNQHAHRQQPGG